VLVAALLIGASAESCEEKKKNAKKPGGALAPVAVVVMTASAPQPGFHWKVTIQGPNFRFREGFEKTLDTTQRIEIVNGKDIHIEWRAWSNKGTIYHARMTVAGGLIKAEEFGNPAVCSQNIPNMFDPKEYK
jgi:hypothetical protein